MVSKKKSSKKLLGKKVSKKLKKKVTKKISKKDFPTLQLKSEEDIAMDFAIKMYKVFDKLIKSIVLFGSVAKKNTSAGSDIDIVVIVDDATIEWNQENILWYRRELDKILQANPYNFHLHINTIRLSTWWRDLMVGDPVVLNIIRYGKTMIDFAGFFDPLKLLLIEGRIKPSPEAIYNCLQRAPQYLSQSKSAVLNAVEGIYWSMVNSSHAALIAAGKMPPSPEHIEEELYLTFVTKNKLDSKYVKNYKEILEMYKDISHGKKKHLQGIEIDELQNNAEEFLEEMTKLIRKIIG